MDLEMTLTSLSKEFSEQKKSLTPRIGNLALLDTHKVVSFNMYNAGIVVVVGSPQRCYCILYGWNVKRGEKTQRKLVKTIENFQTE